MVKKEQRAKSAAPADKTIQNMAAKSEAAKDPTKAASAAKAAPAAQAAEQSPAAEPKPAAVRTADPKPALAPAVDTAPAAETKPAPAAETKPAAEPKPAAVPAADPKPAPAADAAQVPKPKPDTADDPGLPAGGVLDPAAEVVASVLHHELEKNAAEATGVDQAPAADKPADPKPEPDQAPADDEMVYEELEFPEIVQSIDDRAAVVLAGNFATMAFGRSLSHFGYHDTVVASHYWPSGGTRTDHVPSDESPEFAELAAFLLDGGPHPADAAFNHARKRGWLPKDLTWQDAPPPIKWAYEVFRAVLVVVDPLVRQEIRRIHALDQAAAATDAVPGKLPERMRKHKIGYRRAHRFRQSRLLNNPEAAAAARKAAQARQKRRAKRLAKQ